MADVCLIAGMRCTTAARTAVDLARELPHREGVAVLDTALSNRVPRSDLVAALDRQKGWPGSSAAAAALERAAGFAESVLESLARVLFVDAGIPPAVLQAQLRDGEHWTPERVDFCWPDSWVVVEVRFGWEDVILHPARVIERLRAALLRGRHRHSRPAVVRPAYELPA